jgi:hypothetical protein
MTEVLTEDDVWAVTEASNNPKTGACSCFLRERLVVVLWWSE